ncbi:MAG: 30S ribosomal protein S20 [Planctomycetota bacterium]
MPHSKSAKKRARQNEQSRRSNKSQRSALRTQLKKVARAVEAGQRETAEAELGKAIRMLDKAAGKGLIHRNQAARRKARLSAKVAALG